MARPEPLDDVFECEPPEDGSAFIVIRALWKDGQRTILDWRYPTDLDIAEER